MGTDIHGWVEKRIANGWTGVLPLTNLRFENYDMFGCLFGIRNYAHFAPIAPNRGLPSDIAPETQAAAQELATDGHSYSWVGWDEIAAIDWNELAQAPDERVHIYHHQPEQASTQRSDDDLTFFDKVPQSPTLENHLYDDADAEKQWDRKHRMEIDQTVYAEETAQRKHALSASWQQLFDTMATYAGEVGAQNVRLVVWFDS